MPEFGGLQIEVRCVKCGRLPATDVTLYQMQNHFYLCNFCRQEDEQRGKQIAWASGVKMEATVPSHSFYPSTMPRGRARTRPMTRNLPPESIFAKLELSLDMPISKIRETIKQQMTSWMRKPDSAEKKTMIVQLRTWMEKLQDEQAFEEERERLRRLLRKEGSPLSVGGRSVLTAEEFLQACEETREGWADGERYLRSGQLAQWVLFQLGDRDLAMEVRNYQTWTDVSDFRALNGMLYCLVPSHPFRFYQHEQWQRRDDVPLAHTPQELATLCDIHWRLGENHLYEGSMLYWLEHTCGLKGLGDYYASAIAGYADKGPDRGIGLELLLEWAVPSLTKPQLEVTFDGQIGSCCIEYWGREIPHRPIAVKITNTTRGYTGLQMELFPEQSEVEPCWIALNVAPNKTFWGRPGAGMPLGRELTLMNLAQLKPGRKHQCTLNISLCGEYGQSPTVQTFPIVVKKGMKKWPQLLLEIGLTLTSIITLKRATLTFPILPKTIQFFRGLYGKLKSLWAREAL